jgi:predicted MPP superfamily phosphohydrolase
LLTRRRFLRLGCAAVGSGAVASVLGSLYSLRVEPCWVEITNVPVRLPGLPQRWDGLRVAQMSDLHLGPFVRLGQVQRAVELCSGLAADLIVLTGDFVSRSARYATACATELGKLSARLGVYAVLGNHDNWTDADEVAAQLAGAGITVLRDEERGIELDGTRLWLLGIEDAGYTGFGGGSFSDFRAMWQGRAEALAGMLGRVPGDEPRVLLVHNPDFTEMLPEGRIDLALCGHTHGGQVRLPVVGAPAVPSCFGQKYASGLTTNEHTIVYVNRGIGVTGVPVRFNCRPEITLLHLRRN